MSDGGEGRTEVQIKSLTRQKYVSAENGGGMNVPWIEIHLLPGKSLRLDSHHILWRVSSSQFQFRTSQGQFLTCTGLGCSVSATAGSPSTTETFDVDRNNDRVHIKTTIGAYLQATLGGQLTADFPGKPGWDNLYNRDEKIICDKPTCGQEGFPTPRAIAYVELDDNTKSLSAVMFADIGEKIFSCNAQLMKYTAEVNTAALSTLPYSIYQRKNG
ncbi:hypothetical protein CsatA_015484 [Cannabis sativa]